jgi:molybdenum cofactor cytidylyltransferase
MAASASIAPGRIACIVLAAGGSRRLGFPKQLVKRRARSLLTHALRRAAPRVIVVYNAAWASGLASSLNAGLAAVPAYTHSILVTLVDQPNVDERALLRLLRAWRRRPGVPAAALYSGRAGVPAILPRRYWRRIRELRGDAGARALLRGRSITTVDMPEARLDIDTPQNVVELSRPV